MIHMNRIRDRVTSIWWCVLATRSARATLERLAENLVVIAAGWRRRPHDCSLDTSGETKIIALKWIWWGPH